MDWLELLNQIFNIAIIPLLGAATLYLVSFIHAKKKELVEKSKSDMLDKYIELLDKTITDCVIATNQTYVEALKKNGAFNLESQKKAFQLTFDAVMSILTEDAQMYLNEGINDLTAYITNKIESAVAASK